MQNNQSSLHQYFSFDFGLSEDDQNEKVLLEDFNDNEDSFNQSYIEFNSHQNLDDASLNVSQSDSNQELDHKISHRADSLLSTSINYENYDSGEDYSTVEENEIHYLNFIRKSQIAVSQQKALEPLRYRDDRQEENLKSYTVVCIDDSRAMVNTIKMYLDDKIFSVIGINDPLKALMQIVRLKPDLILLDISMPTLDGYELCSLLRKHSSLKETPVIMVTGRKGIINRVKAKMVKASDYLTKPFQKKDLLKVMFKYIV